MSFIIGPGGHPIIVGQVPMMPPGIPMAPGMTMAAPVNAQQIAPPGVTPKVQPEYMTEEELQEKGMISENKVAISCHVVGLHVYMLYWLAVSILELVPQLLFKFVHFYYSTEFKFFMIQLFLLLSTSVADAAI